MLALLSAMHQWHGAVLHWTMGFDEHDRLVLTPVTASGVLRLMLNPAAFGGVLEAPTALEALRRLGDDPRTEFVSDDAPLWDPLIDLSVLTGHRQVTDLHLVNLAARHGARLATLDTRIVPALAPGDRHHVFVVPTGAG